MDISIVILSYNTEELTRRCLLSLKEAGIGALDENRYGFSSEVYVVDNGSSDNSVEMIKVNFPWVKLLVSEKNLGFARGNNLAIPHASGKYILFLNSDTEIFKDTIPEVFLFMEENPEVAVTTCRIELPNGLLDKACRRGFPTPWAACTHFLGLPKLFPRVAFFNRYNLLNLSEEETYEIDATVGAFFFTRRKAMEKVGVWDEDYFFYGEDIDYCYRFKQSGWKIMYYPKVKIIHHKRASGMAKRDEDENLEARKVRAQTINHFYESMKIFYNKHYEDKYSHWLHKLIFATIEGKKRFDLLKNVLRG